MIRRILNWFNPFYIFRVRRAKTRRMAAQRKRFAVILNVTELELEDMLCRLPPVAERRQVNNELFRLRVQRVIMGI